MEKTGLWELGHWDFIVMKCQKERLVANDKNGANISCESMAL